jgi:opacity protein-like surface antigen
MKLSSFCVAVIACACTATASSVAYGETAVEPSQIVYGAMGAQDDDQNQAVHAEVGDDTWYGRISLEAVVSNQTAISVDGLSGLPDLDGTTSFGVHGALGYRFTENVGAEFEIGYIDMQFEPLTFAAGGNSISLDTSLDYTTLLVGPTFDFELTEGVDFVASGLIGLGIGHGKLSATGVIGGNTFSASDSETSTAFAYAVRAGLSFEVVANVHAMVNVRLDGSSDFDFSGIQARPLALGVEAGISFEF